MFATIGFHFAALKIFIGDIDFSDDRVIDIKLLIRTIKIITFKKVIAKKTLQKQGFFVLVYIKASYSALLFICSAI